MLGTQPPHPLHHLALTSTAVGVKALTSIRRGQNIAPYSGEIFHVDNPAVDEEAGYTYGVGLYSIEAKLRGNVSPVAFDVVHL
jgi:hypothetical protein